MIVEQDDEELTLEYEIIEARALQKAENVTEAREKYGQIFKRYPNDPRATLYLAEIYIHNKDFEKNEALPLHFFPSILYMEFCVQLIGFYILILIIHSNITANLHQA